jgi:hypothetical protein
MESEASNLPSDVLWTILATSVASLVLLFAGLYFARKIKPRQQRKGKGKAPAGRPAGRAKAKPKDRPPGLKNR